MELSAPDRTLTFHFSNPFLHNFFFDLFLAGRLTKTHLI